MAIEVLTVDLVPGVRAGFSTRIGGVSPAPWATANLGLGVDDDRGRVQANRDLLGDWIGAPVQFARQMHGTDVIVVSGGSDHDDGRDGNGRAPERAQLDVDPARNVSADALVTNQPGVALGVLVADCVPVLLADPVSGFVGAAHAGRRGLADGVLQRTVEALAALGARPADLRAVVGPAVGGCCYEVPEGLRADVAAIVDGCASTTTWGTPSLDLSAGAVAILHGLGIERVDRMLVCTVTDLRFFSYRRDRVTGRFAGVIRAASA